MNIEVNSASVEEADIELCASGFDNFLMDEDQEELRQYYDMLLQMKAEKCAEVIKELLDWIDKNTDKDAMDVIEADSEKADDLWERYNQASEEEEPRDLAKSFD